MMRKTDARPAPSMRRPLTRSLWPVLLICASLLFPAKVALGEVSAAPSDAFRAALADAGLAEIIPPTGRAILVNIPAFELIAFDEGAAVLRSRVIVGTPWTPTPRLQTYTTAVRFRPTWRPTPSMLATGEYRDGIRPAGPENPLGLAAIRLEPGLLVYLHDTNRRDLFAEENRALSHGCIRVERWDEVIAWLLEMPLEDVHNIANGTHTFDVPAPMVSVTLGYFLSFPDDAGVMQHFDDIYSLQQGGQADGGPVVGDTGGRPLPCA